MNYDAVVIGGGISGMTAALLLAKHGQKVVLLERSKQLAPVVRGFSRDGLYFDTGFHYAGGLGEGGILDRFLRHLGLADKIVKQPYAEDGFDLFRRHGSERDFAFPCGYARAEEHFATLFPQQRQAIRSYLEALRTECRRLPYLNLELLFDEQQLMGTLQGPSLRQVLDGLGVSPPLRQLLTLHGLLYGVPPEEMPFTLHASVIAPYIESTHGIEGGGRQLALAYTERLAELGVDVRCGTTASRIEVGNDGEVVAVQTANEERIPCRRCIASVAPRVLLELVPEKAFRSVYRKRLVRLSETPSAHLLFAACEDSGLLKRRNLFLGGNDSPFANLKKTELAQRTLYLAKAHAEPGSTPRQGLVVICPADQEETAAWQGSRRGQRPADYIAFKQQTMNELARRVSEECPEFGKVTPLEGSTPLTMADYAGNPGGGIYGIKHKVGQYNPQPATRIQGLLLTGQGTVAPGILGATLSAYLCCGYLLGHEILNEEVKACS